MKELSIIEKAKRYDEALHNAKAWYNTFVNTKKDENMKQLIEEIFSELKEESEDERIRKWLIYYFKEVCDNVSEKEKKGVLAWLEKQGGQKPAWSEEDDTFFKAIIRDIENIKYISEDAKKDRINCLKSIKDRHTWKPSERQKEALRWCVVHLGGADKQTLGELLEELNKL